MPNEEVEAWRRAHDAIDAFLIRRIELDETYPMQAFHDDCASHPDDDHSEFVGFHIFGPCPGCGHRTSGACATRFLAVDGPPPTKTQGEKAGFVTTRLPNQAVSPRPLDHELLTRQQVTVLRCACLESHTDSAGAFGCGAEWLLRVFYAPRGRSPRVLMAPVPNCESYRYWVAADANGAALPNSLTTAQAAAGQWQAALTAFVGLVSVGSLVTDRDTVRELSRGWMYALGGALLATVVCNALMLWKSDLASIGFPSIDDAPSVAELEDADLAPLRRAARALRRLRAALGWAVATVVASLAVVAIVLIAPTAGAAAR